MIIKRLDLSNCSVYKLSDTIHNSIESLMLSAVLGRTFIVNNNNLLVGVFSVDHCDKGNDLNMLNKIPCIYNDGNIQQQAMNILSTENGKYLGIIPLIDKNEKLIGAVTCTDNIWDKDKIFCLTKLEYLNEKNLNFEEWFLKSKYINIAFWGLDEVSLSFSNELRRYSHINVMGIYENIKLKEYKEVDYLNYEVDVNFVESVKDILNLDIDLIIVTDWTMRHLSKLPLINKERVDIIYAPQILRDTNITRFMNTSLEKDFKNAMKSKGCDFVTVRIPTEDDMKLPHKEPSMTYDDRMRWLAEQDSWETDSKELEIFNNERHSLCKYIKKSKGNINFSDLKGKYMNYVNKSRIVYNAPLSFKNTVYLIGPCIVISLFNTDKHTLGYYLQEIINNSSLQYKVIPVGMPNDADRYYFIRTLKEYDIKAGDKIFLLDQTYRQSSWDLDLLPVFMKLNEKYGNKYYYDFPVHCGKEGNKAIAEFIFEYIYKCPQISMPAGELSANSNDQAETGKCSNRKIVSANPQLKKYQEFIQNNAIHKMPKIGSIVMNCNPFTLGHQYLVEYAAAQVDYLYIFVVEEDKSYFKFEDRIELVKSGTSHLKNVKVLPSGQFIISALTFSEYFDKANLEGTTIDTSLDVETFGRQIAPCLDISVRFVGEEPLDPITAQYNQSMKEILPKYGIELREIPRKCLGGVISASRVRKCLKENNWDEIKRLVPKTTYLFLERKFK